MAGELVPVVMWPRYSTFSGPLANPADPTVGFKTLAMDVTEFQNAIISVWRAPMPDGATFALNFEESTDGVNWTVCGGVTPDVDPGVDSEVQYTAQLKRRWFRLRLELGGNVLQGTVPVVTAWAAGFLESRES